MDRLKIRPSHERAADIGATDITIFNLMSGPPAGNILYIQAVNEAGVPLQYVILTIFSIKMIPYLAVLYYNLFTKWV